MIRRPRQQEEDDLDTAEGVQAGAPRGMKFTLLTKKGAKHQVWVFPA